MQAFSPDVHFELGLRVANLAFRALALAPFAFVKAARLSKGAALASRQKVRGKKAMVENRIVCIRR
jgi:hypothetical protein